MQIKYKHDEKGMIIFEGMFGIIMCIIVMTILIGLGFFLYQKTVFSIVCNQVAESVVQTYKYKDVSDPGEISEHAVANMGRFRYFNFLWFGTQKSNEQKLKDGFNVRMSRTSLAYAKGGLSGTKITLTPCDDHLGKMHFEVTFEKDYTYLFGHSLDILGLTDITTLKTTVYVSSVDFSYYANSIKLTNYGMKKLSSSTSFIKMLNSAVALVGNGYKMFHKDW